MQVYMRMLIFDLTHARTDVYVRTYIVHTHAHSFLCVCVEDVGVGVYGCGCACVLTWVCIYQMIVHCLLGGVVIICLYERQGMFNETT